MPEPSLHTKKKPAPKKKSAPRVLYLPQRIWYKPLTWRFRPPVPRYAKLPKARHIFKSAILQLWSNKKLFGGIVLIYGVLNIALVRGLSGSSDLGTLKQTIESLVGGVGGKAVSAFGGFAYLLATSGSGSMSNSGPYQYLLLILCSLAFLWALRQVSAKNKPRIRDSFYLGMYPLIPFLLVFLILCVQLVPLAAGGAIYATALSGSLALNGWEKILFFLGFMGLAYWSLRMLTSSVFALYIATLPGMTPFRAVRSASKLVYGRRLLIWRKLIFLPLALLLLAVLIEVPLILFITPLAAWVFFVVGMIALPVTHGYLYNLYREML